MKIIVIKTLVNYYFLHTTLSLLLPISLSSSGYSIQSEEEIKQLSIPSSKEKEEEEIWPPEEPVSGHSFPLMKWFDFSSFFSLPWLFFPHSLCLVGRIITPWVCQIEFQLF